jgi:hypothetical protein
VYIDTGSSVPGVPSVSSLMDLLLELSNKSIQYGNSMCPVNDSKMKSYCFFPQSLYSVKIQIFLFCNDFRHIFHIGDGKGLNYSSYISIGVCVVYIDTGSSVPGVPSKSRDLADENNKILTEWK